VTRSVSLSVNNLPINLDYFVEGYIDHVIGGIIASLKDTGEIKELEMNVDNDGQVRISLNGSDVPLTYFPMEIIRSTLEGMVATLKGVDRVLNPIRIKITR
jgi:hypothetical protein